MNARPVLRCLLLLSLCLMAALVRADPPARVGRISLVSGQVDFRPNADDNASPAQLNWPVYSGNILITDRFGRAEVRIGSTVLRLESETELEFLQLDDTRISLRLIGGGLYLNLRNAEVAKQFEVRNSPRTLKSCPVPGKCGWMPEPAPIRPASKYFPAVSVLSHKDRTCWCGPTNN